MEQGEDELIGKRLQGQFEWNAGGSFRDFTDPDQRVPTLFISGCSSPKDHILEYYLVNNTNENLDFVRVSRSAFVSVDEDIFTSGASKERTYTDVAIDEAVLLTEYDIMFDSDFVLTLSIAISSKELGQLQFTISKKRWSETIPLLYQDGDSDYLQK